MAIVELVGNFLEILQGELDLIACLLVVDQGADRPLAGFHLVDNGLGVRDEGAGVGGRPLDFSDRGEEVVVELGIVHQFADSALAVADLGGDVLQIRDGLGKFWSVVDDQLVDSLEQAAALAAPKTLADISHDLFQPVAQRAQLRDDLVHIDGIPGLDLCARWQERHVARTNGDLDVVAAKQAGRGHRGERVVGDVDFRLDAEYRFGPAPRQAGLSHGADPHSCHQDVIAVVKAFQIVEPGEKHIALRLENAPSVERLERHPEQGHAEKEKEPYADGLHAIIHGRSPVV